MEDILTVGGGQHSNAITDEPDDVVPVGVVDSPHGISGVGEEDANSCAPEGDNRADYNEAPAPPEEDESRSYEATRGTTSVTQPSEPSGAPEEDGGSQQSDVANENSTEHIVSEEQRIEVEVAEAPFTNPPPTTPPTGGSSPAASSDGVEDLTSPPERLDIPAPSAAPVDEAADDRLVNQATYDYMVEHDVPHLIDSLCRRLAEERPSDPVAFLIGHLNAHRAGGYSGGVAVAGTSVGGGWLRTFSAEGKALGQVDRLPLFSEGELNLMVACHKTKSVFIAGLASPTSSAGGVNTNASNTVVRRFSWECELLATYPIGRPISCLGLDRDKDHLWVLHKGGGGNVVQVSTGSRLRDVSLPPATGMHVTREASQGLATSYVWLLSARSIEKRDVDTLQLELTIHLPDSMLKPTTFEVSGPNIWCASASADGASANFCSAFERATGKALPSLIAPTGSIVAFDDLRGGTWHMPQSSTSASATFLNGTGTRLMSVQLREWKKANLVVDRAHGNLWLYSADTGFGAGCRVVCYDPVRCTTVHSHEVPEVAGVTTLMVPL